MRAIPTVFGGTLHRSRTEARWSAFFGEAGIPALYEVEGFEFTTEEGGPTIRYLPDFLLPGWNLWAEVRAIEPAPELIAIHRAFAREKPAIVIHGLPRIHSRFGAGYIVLHYRPGVESPDRYLFGTCRVCGSVAICPESWFKGSNVGDPYVTLCKCIEARQTTFWSRRLIRAYQYGMSQRFNEWFGYQLV